MIERVLRALSGALLLVAVFASDAAAQPKGGAPTKPTQSSPTQNRTVGPRAGGGDDDAPTVTQRAEPQVQPPADPLAVPPEVAPRIGTDWMGPPPPADGDVKRSFKGYYESQRGDSRFRFLPPLVLEHTRGVGTAKEDTEGVYGMLYYRRRSPSADADVLFPAAWRIRDRQNEVLVLGPIVHREAPGEHDNWLAPLAFTGGRADGGYFHIPPLLTTSHWGEKGAFTLMGPYFRDRTGSDVDWGLVPFVFRGDNGNLDGARKTYTLIPPLLFFHRQRELDESRLTVVGPVVSRTDPKRAVFDVLPFLYHIEGKPQTGGVPEAHTTLFPLFHHGRSPDQNLFVIPGYLRRVTPTADTMITPLFTHATTRNESTSLTLAGPIAPLFYRYEDKDTGYGALGIFPFFFHGAGPSGTALLTPLFGRFESYGVSRSYWVAPTLTFGKDQHGWSSALHPLLYAGRSDDSSHTVVAPVFWDFASNKGRTTIGVPVFWRFADQTSDSITQVAGNTLYLQRREAGGIGWSFHVLPVFSYGEDPQGHFWNLLFGLAGYSRSGSYARVRAFWIPITVDSPEVVRAAALH